MQRSRKKRRIIILTIALMLTLAAIVLVRHASRTDAQAQGTVRTAEAQIGSIATTVTGTGNLGLSEGQPLVIPTGLVVDDVFVRAGDAVNHGDVLARFTPASIQARIAEVQEGLGELDEEIQAIINQAPSTAITAGVSGRISAIYAEVDDFVTDIMLAHGALARIALDNGAEIEITGVSGRVQTIHFSEDHRVYAGARLFTLSEMETSPAHQALLNERAEKAELLRHLLALSRTGMIHADFSGIVESVLIGDNPSSIGGEQSRTPMPGGGSGGFSGMFGGGLMRGTGSSHTATQLARAPTEGNMREINSLADLELGIVATGAMPQRMIVGADYMGTVEWSPNDPIFLPDTVYTATLTLITRPGVIFSPMVLTELAQAGIPVPDAEVMDARLISEFDTLEITVAFPETESLPDLPNLQLPGGGINLPPGMDGDGSIDLPSGFGGGGIIIPPGIGGSFAVPPGLDAPGLGGLDASGGNTITAFTIAADEVMRLIVTVDELDILSLQAGQTAEVTLEAVPDTEFHGIISRIDTTGQSAGGTTRYAVEITLVRTAQMLPGMSAAAVITIEQVTDILVVPVGALQEEWPRVFVYTELDSSGNPTRAIDVLTGLSDGVYVEILAGLSLGDNVYYLVAEDEMWPHWGRGSGSAWR